MTDDVSPEQARAARRSHLADLARNRAVAAAAADEIGLRIAGLPVVLRVADRRFAERLGSAFRRFLAPMQEPALAVDVGIDEQAAIWRDPSPEPRVRSEDGLLLVEHRDFAATLASDGSRIALVQPRRTISTENGLRVLLALALLRRGGLLLHAAGVIGRGRATALFGGSGSGKSTAARLARGRPLLGDDLVAVTCTADGWFAHATPFGGGAARRRAARAARLGSLLRLRHGAAFELRPLAPAAAVGELLRSTVLPAASSSDRALALERCAELEAAVGVRELRFPVDNGLWRFLRERGV
jgi:hypothetical protein